MYFDTHLTLTQTNIKSLILINLPHEKGFSGHLSVSFLLNTVIRPNEDEF